MKKITQGSSRNKIFWRKLRISWSRYTDFLISCMCAKLCQLCPTLCNLMAWYVPGSSVHGILQAGILKWAAISSSRGSSRPRIWTCLSFVSLAGRFFTISATWEALYYLYPLLTPFIKPIIKPIIKAVSYLYPLLKWNWIIILHTI